ncbi:MAG: hypothetical protein GY835_02140 [bacterium]|nr:hypothetical protein [bacterium]
MKRYWLILVLVFAPILLMISMDANAACEPDVIYLVSDLATGQCSHLPVADEPFTLYIVIKQNWLLEPITDAYNINLPEWPVDFDPALGQIDYHWTADVVAGDLASGLELHWSEPLEPFDSDGDNHFYLLGRIDIVAHDPAWLAGRSFYFHFMITWYRDIWGHESDLLPSYFTFDNLRGYECNDFISDPPSHLFFGDHFLPRNAAVVPELFYLDFDVYFMWCLGQNWDDYWGELYLDDELIHEFYDSGSTHYHLPIDLAGYQTGDAVALHLHLVDHFGNERDYYLSYTLGTGSTPVMQDRSSFSVVKSFY